MFKTLIYVALLVWLSSPSYAQDDKIMPFIKRFDSISSITATEKIHIHFDKPYYAAGDDLWYKAYVLDAKTGQLSSRSKVLHIEFASLSGKLIKKQTLPMTNGLTWGDFKIPDDLAAGSYRIRAYTHWMRNWGEDKIFDKILKVGNYWENQISIQFSEKPLPGDSIEVNLSFRDQKPLASTDVFVKYAGKKTTWTTNTDGELKVKLPKNQSSFYAGLVLNDNNVVERLLTLNNNAQTIDVQFLPEGGKLVQGIGAKVAVKAVKTNGFGAQVKGVITDQNGLEITQFETNEFGMGSFKLIPEPNKTYSAKVLDKIIAIPQAEKSGHTLAIVQDGKGKIIVDVRFSLDLLNSGNLQLFVHRDGKPYSITPINTTHKQNQVIFDTNEFPYGILTFTLLSPNARPLAERIIFVKNNVEKIELALENLAKSYEKRGKTDLSLSAKAGQKSIQGSFSVSVTNEDILLPNPANENDIRTNFLIKSELIGYIENPNQYFADDEIKTQIALDHLMLTQGWRKIDWALKTPSLAFQPEQGLRIAGQVTKTTNPVPRSQVSLIANNGEIFKIDTVANDQGYFAFDKLEFADSTKFILQAKSETNKKDVRINLEPLPNLPISELSLNQYELDEIGEIVNFNQIFKPFFEIKTRPTNLKNGISLKAVDIKGNKVNLAPNSKNLNGPGNADQIIDLSQIELANSVSQYLRGRIAGVIIDNKGKATNMKTFKASFDGIDKNGKYSGDTRPQFMNVVLDGNFMTDFNIDELNPRDIESIEVLTSLAKLAVYGPNASRGLIVVTSKTGATGGNSQIPKIEYAPGITTFIPPGFTISREFYSPKYDIKPSSQPDYRTTVFWAPNIVTDDKGQAKLEFFNTDQPGNYRIVIEGVDLDGRIGRKTFNYTVK